MDHRERPRRLRGDRLRPLVRETELAASDLIAPVFVDAHADAPVPIPSMPNYDRYPVESVAEHVEALRSRGVRGIILFGIPTEKDASGSRAWAEDGVVQRALRRLDDGVGDDLARLTDVCLCEYTEHGHCGVLQADGHLTVDNDPSVDLLGKIAVSHAEAGADAVAPSASLDYMVGAIRTALDDAGFHALPIVSYSVKYNSAFYGPFRDAADGAPAFGDRRHYQMEAGNRTEALREVRLDIEEGADAVMVKPALAYLDVVSTVVSAVDVPVLAYNVSGEYAMIKAAEARGWLDGEAAAREGLTAIKRAGAGPIISYFTPEIVADL